MREAPAAWSWSSWEALLLALSQATLISLPDDEVAARLRGSEAWLALVPLTVPPAVL